MSQNQSQYNFSQRVQVPKLSSLNSSIDSSTTNIDSHNQTLKDSFNAHSFFLFFKFFIF